MDFDSNLLDVNLQTMDSTSIADCLEPLREFQNEDNRLDEGLPEIASGDGRTKRVKSKRPEKPPISYIALIYMAIEHQPSQRATLADIYRYLQENYQFFRSEYTGWKNSIRHNLSLNECFIKLPKKEGGKTGKGHYWAIDENSKYLLEEGCLKRRPRGYKLKTGLGGGGSSNGSDSSPTSDGSMGVQEIHGHHMNLNGSNSNESIHQDMVNQQVNGHFLLPEGSFHPDPYVYSQPPLDPLQQGQVWYQQAMEEPNVVAGGSSTEQWMTTGVQNPNFLDFSLKPEGSYLTPSLEGENGYYHTHHYYCPDPLVPTSYFYDEKNFTSYPDHLPIPQNPQIFQQNQYEQKYIFKNEQI